MSEAFPVSDTPDSRPNQEPYADIIGIAMGVARGLDESLDEFDAFSQGVDAVNQIEDLIRGQTYEVLSTCSDVDLRLGELKLPLGNRESMVIAGRIHNFNLVKTPEGMRIGMIVTDLTTPSIELPEDMDKTELRSTVLLSDILSYTYTRVS